MRSTNTLVSRPCLSKFPYFVLNMLLMNSENMNFVFKNHLCCLAIGVIAGEEQQFDGQWTDQPLLQFGVLSAIEVEEQGGGSSIQRLRARCHPFPSPLPPFQVWARKVVAMAGNRIPVPESTASSAAPVGQLGADLWLQRRC